MLEDLCLKSVEKDKEMTCVKEFTNCISKLKMIHDNPSKAKAQVYLASKPKYIAHIGLGAKENYWHFESDIFNDIRRFKEFSMHYGLNFDTSLMGYQYNSVIVAVVS